MAAHTFEYQTGQIPPSSAFPRGHEAKRPQLSVILRYGDRHTRKFDAIVDTGADYCMFPSSLAEELGLNLDTLPIGYVSGLGDDEGVHFVDVCLWHSELGEWVITAGFSAHTENFMLGHKGFLERFIAAFDYQNGRFVLEDIPLE